MKKITFATVVSSALAALAIGLAGPALSDAGSGSNVPAPAPVNGLRVDGGGREPVRSVRHRPVRPIRRLGAGLSGHRLARIFVSPSSTVAGGEPSAT